MISEHTYQKLSEKLTLKIIQTGSDKTNFKILDMLPSDVNTMMKELNLTKVPVNVRLNKLEKVGLVKRWRGTGLVVLTDLGKDFTVMISKGEYIVKCKLEEMLEKVI